jgi:hypothetical protein
MSTIQLHRYDLLAGIVICGIGFAIFINLVLQGVFSPGLPTESFTTHGNTSLLLMVACIPLIIGGNCLIIRAHMMRSH